MAKLNEEIVLEIRERYKNNNHIKEFQKDYDIPYSTLCKICYRQTWKHI